MRVYEYHEMGGCPSYSLTQSLKGYANKNWPIRSSFMVRREGKSQLFCLTLELTKHDCIKVNDFYAHTVNTLESTDRFNPIGTYETSVLLATGSADPHVYIYDVSSGKVQNCNLRVNF